MRNKPNHKPQLGDNNVSDSANNSSNTVNSSNIDNPRNIDNANNSEKRAQWFRDVRKVNRRAHREAADSHAKSGLGSPPANHSTLQATRKNYVRDLWIYSGALIIFMPLNAQVFSLAVLVFLSLSILDNESTPD